MNQYQAKQLVKRLAIELFNMEFNAPIEINGRLTRALGRFTSRKNRTPVKLELAARLLTNYSDATIESVIKHELCHWYLCITNQPFHDGQPEFEAELRRVGAHSTGEIKLAGEVHQMLCRCCNREVVSSNSRGKLNKYIENRRGYTSRCCKAGLVYAGVKYIEDKNTQGETTKLPEQPRHIPTPRPVQQPTAAIKTVSATEITIDLVLEKGPRGVTNKQMIPAIQKVLDMNDKFLLYKLQQAYPSVFQATIRYIGKSYQAQLQSMMG
jgi:predicted SprT family Zn-dependent metalloprotease